MAKQKIDQKGLRYPPLNNLIGHVHNKYELVLAVSKRAREIVSGETPYVMTTDIDNPISIATEEIDEGKIEFVNPTLDKKFKEEDQE